MPVKQEAHTIHGWEDVTRLGNIKNTKEQMANELNQEMDCDVDWLKFNTDELDIIYHIFSLAHFVNTFLGKHIEKAMASKQEALDSFSAELNKLAPPSQGPDKDISLILNNHIPNWVNTKSMRPGKLLCWHCYHYINYVYIIPKFRRHEQTMELQECCKCGRQRHWTDGLVCGY